MNRPLTESQVLKKLDIVDFRHLTKDKVMSMATMLDKMDPEVAKKVLDQFPDFSSSVKQLLTEFKQSIDESIKANAEGVQSFYDTCDAIISSCQQLLEKEDLSFEERRSILERMVEIAKMKSDKNSEDKRFTVTMSVILLAAVVSATISLVTALGGNFKLDTDRA